MRLTLSRAALAALLLLTPAVPFAVAQDQAPSSEPSIEAPAPADPSAEPSVEPPADALGPKPDDKHPRTAEEIYQDLDFFGQVFDRIRSEYVDAPDEQALIRAAIQGMLTSLDPHSGYLDPAEFDQTQEDTSGHFGGLGIEVTMEQGVIKVISPIDDTPAQRAGILANDYIVELDGTSVQGISIDEAVGKMKGPVGSKIKLTVVREGATDPLYFELTRDVIAQRVVRYTMEGDVAVLRLARLDRKSVV